MESQSEQRRLEYRNELLIISMIGYENFEAPIWSLLDNDTKVILMSKSTTVLPEIVVTDSLTGGEILQIALSRVEQNFPMQPFLMEGFYRDVKKVGGTYISLLEAAVKIFDESYAEPRNKSKLRERVKLVEVRKSLGYDNKFTTYFGQRNLLEDLLLHNNIRYRQIEADDEFLNNIVREKDSFYNDQEIYVVSNTKDFFLQVYINKADYSILHLEFEISGDSQEAQQAQFVDNLVADRLDHWRRVNAAQLIGPSRRGSGHRVDGRVAIGVSSFAEVTGLGAKGDGIDGSAVRGEKANGFTTPGEIETDVQVRTGRAVEDGQAVGPD